MTRKTFKAIAGLVTLFMTLPIWFYLFYKILEAVNASELMWFLYWIYVPVATFINIVGKLIEEDV